MNVFIVYTDEGFKIFKTNKKAKDFCLSYANKRYKRMGKYYIENYTLNDFIEDYKIKPIKRSVLK